jgi:hypothetical protein
MTTIIQRKGIANPRLTASELQIRLNEEKNGFISNFSVNITSKWGEEKKVEFLKSRFLQNKQ